MRYRTETAKEHFKSEKGKNYMSVRRGAVVKRVAHISTIVLVNI